MRKMSHEKRRAKLAKLNGLLVTYKKLALENPGFISPLTTVAGKIASITEDWDQWVSIIKGVYAFYAVTSLHHNQE